MRADVGYGLAAAAPQPVVISLNRVIAWLAVSELLDLVTVYKPLQPYSFYDGLRRHATAVHVGRNSECICCGNGSMAVLDDVAPLTFTDAADTKSASVVPTLSR